MQWSLLGRLAVWEWRCYPTLMMELETVSETIGHSAVLTRLHYLAVLRNSGLEVCLSPWIPGGSHSPFFSIQCCSLGPRKQTQEEGCLLSAECSNLQHLGPFSQCSNPFHPVYTILLPAADFIITLHAMTSNQIISPITSNFPRDIFSRNGPTDHRK
jgi:hypothetical protein